MTLPMPGASWQVWGRSLVRALNQRLNRLSFLRSDSSAAEDGAVMWDAGDGYPVVSKGGAWRQIVLANGYGSLIQNADVTAALADTAYAVTFDDPTEASGVSRSGSQISVTEGGLYRVRFGAQIYSTSGSTVVFRLWLAKEGANIANSMVMSHMHHNGDTSPIGKERLVSLDAGDYIEVKWSTDSTSGSLKAQASTAYAPASASAYVILSRVHA